MTIQKKLCASVLSLSVCLTVTATHSATADDAHSVDSARHIVVDVNGPATARDYFYNLSVGSDFPGTLIRDDSMEQLALVEKELKFRYIRFHGIFHDVLNVYKVINGAPVYDWTKVDYLYDRLLKIGIKPFVELSFTPQAMATSGNKIFYWNGNTSHPDIKQWNALVDAFIRHIESRYGQQEVRSWFFEVWNEPNLNGFWEGADQQAYFDLYDHTARTIKSIDSALRIGGPSTAGAAWVPQFITHVKETGTALDFITTHTYGVDGGFLDEEGKSDTKLSPSQDAIVGDIRKVRAEITASAMPTLPLYITEWSTSYTPRDPVHDSYVSAPYILSKLKASEGLLQGMSYWTFSDLFEESGPPPTPYHGGFGLLNREGIPKAAYFAYKYLAELGDVTLSNSDAQSYVTRKGKIISALVWDFQQPVQDKSDRPFYTKVFPTKPSTSAVLDLKGLASGQYCVNTYRTGFKANDAHTAYLEMGSPKSLTSEQVTQLKSLTEDKPITSKLKVGKQHSINYTIDMRANDIVLVKFAPCKL